MFGFGWSESERNGARRDERRGVPLVALARRVAKAVDGQCPVLAPQGVGANQKSTITPPMSSWKITTKRAARRVRGNPKNTKGGI